MQNQAIDHLIEDSKSTRLDLYTQRTKPKFLQDPEKPGPEPRMALGQALSSVEGANSETPAAWHKACLMKVLRNDIVPLLCYQ